MSSSIEIRNLDAYRRHLRRLGDEAKADLKRVNLDAARDVMVEAQRRAPRRSGRLAGSIRASGQLGAGVVRAGRKAVPYAAPVHFGWATRPRRPWGTPGRVGGGPIAPNPFLYDAVDARRNSVLRRYEVEMARLAQKYS